MRNIKELLQVVIDSLKKGDKDYFYNFGICGEISDLLDIGTITSEEHGMLYGILKENRPSKVTGDFVQFTESEHWSGEGTAFWWKQMDRAPETRQIRIKYLECLRDSL